MKKIAITLVWAVLLFGCATDRLNIPNAGMLTPEKVSKIETGVTTKENVKAVFGEPYDRIVLKSGAENWFYKDFNLHTLYIEFGPDGIVKFFNFN